MRPDLPDAMRYFEPWLDHWGLEPDGPPTATRTGRFLPVLYRSRPAMLKVVTEPEERDGARVLTWWAGEGAVTVFDYYHDAVLLERATGPGSLAALARQGGDLEATRVLCRVAATLHAKDPADRPAAVVPLERWFAALWPAARSHGGVLATGAEVATRLLADQRDSVVLHGDLHHDNVLDFGARGWLAIDPKGLYGERTFDYVNLLRNPGDDIALAPGRFQAQVDCIVYEARLDRTRLLEWTLAFTCLSAAWYLGDGDEPVTDLAIAGLAVTELSGDA